MDGVAKRLFGDLQRLKASLQRLGILKGASAAKSSFLEDLTADDKQPNLIPLVFTWHVARLYAYNFRDFYRILVYRLTPQVYREKDPVLLNNIINPAKEIQTQSHARQYFFLQAIVSIRRNSLTNPAHSEILRD